MHIIWYQWTHYVMYVLNLFKSDLGWFGIRMIIRVQDGGYLVRFGMVELAVLEFCFKTEIRTIQHPSNFGPFKIWTCLVFELTLYCNLLFRIARLFPDVWMGPRKRRASTSSTLSHRLRSSQVEAYPMKKNYIIFYKAKSWIRPMHLNFSGFEQHLQISWESTRNNIHNTSASWS